MERTLASAPDSLVSLPYLPPPYLPARAPAVVMPTSNPLAATRSGTVITRRPKSSPLDALASRIGSALLEAPAEVWTLLGRAWFFLAGATAGLLIGAAFFAASANHEPPHTGAVSVSVSSVEGARAFVVERPLVVPSRAAVQPGREKAGKRRAPTAARGPARSRRAL